MRSLVDFLNHGILPFVGRASEWERIVSFWRDTAEAQGLRAAVMVGEAGVGKSRLIDETLPWITSAGGAVVHAKLYPDTTTSIAPLLAGALWRSGVGRHLLAEKPEERLDSVGAALRRISRLRPLFLIIEDIHLLHGQPLQELKLLLEMITDETLSVLCLARPVELPARGVLERWIVEEIELAGITAEEMSMLWRAMFGAEPEQAVVDLLMARTLGNPLATRSVLRAAAVSGAIAIADDESGIWRLKIPLAQFEASLERSVNLLSEGMTTGLNDEERDCARRLASLGEVFSYEAACVMSPGAGRVIESLTFKGVLATSRTAAAHLHETASAYPQLAFTHTLLHKHFTALARPDAARLIRVIGDELPLYSVLPFQLLRDHRDALSVSPAEVDRAVRRSLRIAHALDNSPDWELAMGVWEAAAALVESAGIDWTETQRLDLGAELLHYRLMLLRRTDHTDEFRAYADRYLALTTVTSTEDQARHRLLSLVHLNRSDHRRQRAAKRYREVWSEVEGLIRRFPALMINRAYIAYLRDVAGFARVGGDVATLKLVEERLEEILANPGVTGEFRDFARRLIIPQIISEYDPPEMVDQRLRTLADLEKLSAPGDSALKIMRIELLYMSGRLDEARQVCTPLLAGFKERGLMRSYVNYMFVQLDIRAALGHDLDEIDAALDDLFTSASDSLNYGLRRDVLAAIPATGIMIGHATWARSLADRFTTLEQGAPLDVRIGLALAEHDMDGLRAIAAEPNDESTLHQIVMAAVGTSGRHETALAAARVILRAPLLRYRDLFKLHVVMALVEATPGLAAALAHELHGALLHALEWLAERHLDVLMAALVERWGGLLRKPEARSWRARIDAITAARQRTVAKGGDGRIRLSMLGVVAVTRPGQEPTRVRGLRLRAVLGLMVADRMLADPLGHREFCHVAAGKEEEPEHARKILNVTIHRLREMLGHDAIVTDGATPQLSLEHVEVDLLEANRLLDEAMHAARRGALLRAVPALRAAFDLARGEVPFPTLYDNFFEAAREDFECRLHQTIIEVSRGLIAEHDHAGAEDILRRSITILPGDEDLSEILCDLLSTMGKQTEAARVRMRTAVEA